ncbi:cation:proton antiporter [Sideroxydans lithotrophicus]|uniref:Sodium/hydrogen exchanger n=1 Tax=Sideroxydans lithotrophicus (strain ES-1) TaxID=580332 RepID=D5CUF8_SIDLE|nr:cation:proton antiporter [Sideroxydans lithotrophicus]ADE12345.1 sodium/hydrogen exchanger [Sideroxydans lithotrophicus ES-1]
MNSQTFLLQLLGILIASRIFAELAVRLKSPSVIGELLAGVALGPSLLGWIEPTQTFRLLAEIGIILLLFDVGLETDIMQLVRAGSRSVVVAITGFILPFVLGFALCFWGFGLAMIVSLFVAGTITATSIGITLRVLADLDRQHSHEAQVILGAAVIDDILGILLLALLYEFSVSGNVDFTESGKVLLFVLAFFLIAPAAAKLMSVLIQHFDQASALPGLIPISIVSLVLFFAWFAHAIGAPELLGGFAAGLALSRRFFLPFGLALHSNPSFNEQVEKQMLPIINLFTPIFFVVVGLSLNLQQVNWNSVFVYAFSASLLLVAIAGKLVGALLLREPMHVRWAIGISMVPRGEVGLIFAELGRANGILVDDVYAATIIVIALTTLLPPFVLKAFYNRHGDRFKATS